MDGREVVCESCGRAGPAGSERCPACGSGATATVVDGFVVAFAAGTRPCADCGTTARPLELRGWVLLTGLLLWQRERRRSAYVCSECARWETAHFLLHNAAFGWWSVPALLFFAPRATLHNWRAAFTSPFAPRRWRALPAAEITAPKLERDPSPLQGLSSGERELVTRAHALYERLDTRPDADAAEIRRAFRAQAKRLHPDARRPDPFDTDQMVLLNQAWEILSSKRLRAAYDWLQRERVEQR